MIRERFSSHLKNIITILEKEINVKIDFIEYRISIEEVAIGVIKIPLILIEIYETYAVLNVPKKKKKRMYDKIKYNYNFNNKKWIKEKEGLYVTY